MTAHRIGTKEESPDAGAGAGAGPACVGTCFASFGTSEYLLRDNKNDPASARRYCLLDIVGLSTMTI